MGAPERELTASEAHKHWKAVWARPVLSADAMKPYRVVLAWRFTREVALRTQVIREAQRLRDIELEWDHIWTGAAPNKMADVPISEWALAGVLNREPGIQLHPGNKPMDERFHRALELLVRELRLDKGCSAIPELAYYGLQGLDTLWPSQEDILEFEDNLLNGTIAQIEHKGDTRVIDYVRSLTGMGLSACRSFLRAAEHQLMNDTTNDPDTETAKMVRQLDNVIFRAQQDNDKGAELRAQKQKADLLGLLKTVGSAKYKEALDWVKAHEEDDEDHDQTDAAIEADDEFRSPDPT